MNEILSFVSNHWQLSAVFIALLVAYLLFEFTQSANKKEVSPERAVSLYNHQQALLLDIRSSNDFSNGHIVGALQFDVVETEDQVKKLQKYAQKPIIVISVDGKQALSFANRLEAQGFVQVFTLAGGIRGWQAAGLPLVKKG